MPRKRPPRVERPSTAAGPIGEAERERAAAVAAEVRQRLASVAEPRVAAQHRERYGEGVPCHGVPIAQANRIGQDAMRRIRGAGLPLALAVADDLLSGGNLEEGVAADVILSAQARHVGGAEFEHFARWAERLTNEVNADALAAHMVSRSLAGRPSLVKTLREWARAPQPLRRRAAVMAFTPLVREGRFLTDALSVAELLMEDADEVVRQGVAALLVDASRLQAERVAEFLEEWRERSPQTLLHAASAKLRPDQRARVLDA